jgi:hypothetical protein
MSDIKTYRNLIKEIPIKKQSMRAKKSVWHTRLGHSLFKVVEPVFSKDEITITRGEILKEENNRIKIVKTLVWGYPEGGRGSNVKSVLENLEVLRDKLSKYKGKNLTETKAKELISDLKKVDKLGPSTWSKLLYFFEVSINSHRCQIFDKRVEQSLNESQFRDFKKEKGKWNQKRVDDFFKYIEKLNELSRNLRVDPDQIENFLFYYNLYFKL